MDELVVAGQLPPVEEPLPEGPLRVGPQRCLALFDFAASAEYVDSARTLTVTLRSGHKWSDRHPVTADDLVFWYRPVKTAFVIVSQASTRTRLRRDPYYITLEYTLGETPRRSLSSCSRPIGARWGYYQPRADQRLAAGG